ncbi:ATP-binding protein [Xanthomonas medicagonis]|uniref:ATP-binding protein n=1 Tax=Xanthomonas medicagonis TaxID=3160841 RepID=UPI0035154C34
MRLIKHPAYESPRAQLQRELENHRPGHMVFIIGPSGVGKTTMRRSVMQGMFGHPTQWGRGMTPVVEVFATYAKNAYFSSLDFAKHLLDELHAPSLNWLLSSSMPADEVAAIRRELEHCEKVWTELRPKRGTEGDYWRWFQRGLGARGCKYVSIDQATVLLVNHRNKSPADHTLHLMSLAEASGVMFIMTGVHQASDLWAVHHELRRRVAVVWVPPYGEKRVSDVENFRRLLKSMENRYPCSKSGLLNGMAFDVMYATGGVFAEVCQLLERANGKAQSDGGGKILKRHIEDSYLSNRDLEVLWGGIRAFEAAMRPGDVSKGAAAIRERWAAQHTMSVSSEVSQGAVDGQGPSGQSV